MPNPPDTFRDAARRAQTPQKPPAAGPPPRRGGRGWLIGGLIAGVLVAILALVGTYVVRGYLADTPRLPDRAALWSVRRSPGMTFLDRNGQVIATRGAKYGQRVTLAALPAYVPKAFLAAEDKRFYQHGPLDFHAIARALRADLKAHRSAQGASTLTQQLARSLFLQRDQSLKRKLQEAYLAWRLEQTLSKDEILELYLNRTYFGAGAYGLDAAAQTYFSKPASALTLAEAATLAGLPNAPSRLALTNDMPAALARAHLILDTMRTETWITPQQEQAALAAPPQLVSSHTGEGDYSYVLDQAAFQALQLSNGAAPDLVVTTTIDPALQAAGVEAVRSVVEGEGRRRAVSQGALVSLAPDGAILAMVGGLDHGRSAYNRVVQARRQPGSSFKAFVFGAAIEHGIGPNDVRQDAPIALGHWSPEDYGHHYAGPVTLTQALARSINTVAVRLALEVGPDTVAELARRFGLADIPAHPGPSIALGAYEVSPLELAAGYQVFQTGGGKTTPYLVSEVRSTHGDVLYSHTPSAPIPVYDPLFATRMVGMLKTVITSGTGTRANIGRPAAGKTGTSQNYRDAWFVGFTPDLLAAVWVGNDNGRPMAKVTGGELPAEIWRRFMVQAEKNLAPRDFPWLVAEPTPPPSAGPEETGPPMEDQPPAMDEPPVDGPPMDDRDVAPGGPAGPGDDERPPPSDEQNLYPDDPPAQARDYGPADRGDGAEDPRAAPDDYQRPPPSRDTGQDRAYRPPPQREGDDDNQDPDAGAPPRYRY